MNQKELEELLINTFNISDSNTLYNLNIYYNMHVETSKVMYLTTIVSCY